MENDIKALVEKYGLIRVGDKIAARKHIGSKDVFVRDVGPRKAEILQYFAAQEQAAAELRTKQTATFEAIPGVAELRKARSQWGERKNEFDRMMEAGDGMMRKVEGPTSAELAEIEGRYPMAVFALEAENRAISTENLDLCAIWRATYEALCDGQPPERVKADHDERMKDYTDKHIWD